MKARQTRSLKNWVKQAWSKRHKKHARVIFTLFGAFLLVTTFLIHEYLQEEAKDRRDKYEASLLLKQVSTLIVDNQEVEAQQRMGSKSYGTDIVSQLTAISANMGFASSIYAVTDREIDFGNQLVDAFEKKDDRDDLSSKLARTSLELNKCQKDEVAKEVAGALQNVKSGVVSGSDAALQVESLSQKVMNTATCVIFVELSSRFVIDDVTNKAKEASKKAENERKRWTQWSCFLVPFGFLLSAFGQLTGLGEIKNE